MDLPIVTLIKNCADLDPSPLRGQLEVPWVSAQGYPPIPSSQLTLGLWVPAEPGSWIPSQGVETEVASKSWDYHKRNELCELIPFWYNLLA